MNLKMRPIYHEISWRSQSGWYEQCLSSSVERFPKPKQQISGDTDHPKNFHLCKGSENRMLLRKQYYIEWICMFNMVWYPFDSQTCGRHFYSFNDFTALTPLTMSYEGPMELAEYFVKDIMICSQTLQNKTGISVVVTLGRPLINNIFTIFTPTILLLGIAHISRVFDKDHPDMVVMVCLTVILVQASLWVSVFT